MSESQTTCEATKLVIIFPSMKPRRFLEQRWNQKGRHMGREESHQHLNPLICNLAAVYCEKPTVQVNEKKRIFDEVFICLFFTVLSTTSLIWAMGLHWWRATQTSHLTTTNGTTLWFPGMPTMCIRSRSTHAPWRSTPMEPGTWTSKVRLGCTVWDTRQCCQISWEKVKQTSCTIAEHRLLNMGGAPLGVVQWHCRGDAGRMNECNAAYYPVLKPDWLKA